MGAIPVPLGGQLCRPALHPASSTAPLVQLRLPPPRRRISGRIWPEYRLHTLIFSLRHLACIGQDWYELRYDTLTPDYIRGLICFTTLAAVDLASAWVGKHHSPTIRDFSVHPAVKVFLSWTQIKVTLAVLRGYGQIGTQFGILFVIQFNPFLMTLVRRGMISAVSGEYLYSGYLLYLYVVPLFQWMYAAPVEFLSSLTAEADLMAAAVLLLRMAGVSKFIVWLMVYLLDHMTAYDKGLDSEWRTTVQPCIFISIHFMLVLVAVRNSVRDMSAHRDPRAPIPSAT